MEPQKLVKSKIVATLGPASSSEEMLTQLRDAGVDLFRINMSHASKEGKEVMELVNRIRSVTPEIGILCDIQGPKIRIGEVEGTVELHFGDPFDVYENSVIGNKTQASISYPGFFHDIQVGDSIFINDGLIRVEVMSKTKKNQCVHTIVRAGGPISSRKGVNIPSGKLSMHNPTDKDVKDLKLIAPLSPEYVAASFIATAKEVRTVRAILNNAGAGDVKIISKIERPIALTNFDAILEASDGIMVARGDLGVEIPAEDVPIRQKEIILKCNRAGKPVIVATQMLESMTQNPVPTRAEVNDVFNAVYDRSDAVMLSGETSVGKFPLKAVKSMDRIIQKAEEYIPPLAPEEIDSAEPELYEAVGHAVFELARVFHTVNFRGKIVMFTHGGKSPRMAAKYRPMFPIFAITGNPKTARQLQLVWGVSPVFIRSLEMDKWSAEKVMQHGIKKLVDYGLIETKEHVICTVPSRLSPGRCSIIGLYYVADILKDSEVSPESYNPKWK
ncbi:MAG: pyruvate kinase [Promethearchaeota archaeon]